MSNQKKAQSALEYIIVFTVIVGAILLAANTLIRQKMNNIFEHVTNQTERAVEHVNFE
jgi:uncharacterized protein YpmB